MTSVKQSPTAKSEKMECLIFARYMNLHLEISTAPMHFLTMATIEIRDADSPYKYAFTLIDMLTNYVREIPLGQWYQLHQ